MREQSLCKIAVGKGEYYLHATLHDEGLDGFDLILSDGENAWCGTVSGDDLEDLKDKVKMEIDEFISQTRKALTRQNMGSFNFQYTVKTHGDEEVELQWKKFMPHENIKFQLGAVRLTLKDDPSVAIRLMLDYAISNATELQEQINALQTDNARLITERDKALKRLERCITAKEELEHHLYAKFAVVVNDKKAKIRAMKDQGGDRSASVESVEQSIAAPSTSTSHHQSDSDNDRDHNQEDGMETDEEKTPSPSVKRRRRVQVKQEVKDEQDSLILDDGEEEVTDAGPTRRRRKRDPPVKKTPSRPVIPKVSSTSSNDDKTPSRGSSKRTSKKPSLKSKDSSDGSVDDLIGQL